MFSRPAIVHDREAGLVEVEKCRELLMLLEQLGVSPFAEPSDENVIDESGDGDAESEQWASLIFEADDNLLREARLRACRNGLAAIERYLAEKAAA